MSGVANALVILVVVGVVIARQLTPREIGAGRWWLIPAALVVLAIRDGGSLVDTHHQDAAVALLGGELVVGALTGAAWAITTRVWTDAEGRAWAQGTKATIGVWLLGIAARLGLYGIARAAGVHQSSVTVLLAVAVTLLIRQGVLTWRARAVHPSYRTAS